MIGFFVNELLNKISFFVKQEYQEWFIAVISYSINQIKGPSKKCDKSFKKNESSSAPFNKEIYCEIHGQLNLIRSKTVSWKLIVRNLIC